MPTTIKPRPRRSPVSSKSLPFRFGHAMPETPQAYYDALRSWQESQGLSARKMAELLGCSNKTVSNWLNGENIGRKYWPIIREATGMYFDRDAAMGEIAGHARPVELQERDTDYMAGTVVTLNADVRNILQIWLEAKGITPRALASLMGYDKPRVLEDIFYTGKRREVTVEKLAAMVRVTEFNLERLPADSEVRTALQHEPPKRHMTRMVPALTFARAQELPSLTGYQNAEPAERWCAVPTDGKAWGCAEVLGWSMWPGYPEGTLVAGHYHEGPPGHRLMNGADVAIRYTELDSGEPVFVFKRFTQRNAEGMLILESLDGYTDPLLVDERTVDWFWEVTIFDKTGAKRRR